jgi:hypothetical protein
VYWVERIGRLMDAEIMGTANYKALDLQICAGIWKELIYHQM